jgi:hypothetical protein
MPRSFPLSEPYLGNYARNACCAEALKTGLVEGIKKQLGLKRQQ